MPLKITQRKASEVPQPTGQGTINKDLELLKAELAKLTADVVLEVDAGAASAVRGTKNLITRASKQVGIAIRHWHDGTKVFVQPTPRKATRKRAPAQSRDAVSEGRSLGQCKAKTASGARCASPAKPPSRSLCGRHQNALAGGTSVVNFETGRRFAKSG